jgi:hypothetical protein
MPWGESQQEISFFNGKQVSTGTYLQLEPVQDGINLLVLGTVFRPIHGKVGKSIFMRYLKIGESIILNI